MDTVELGMDDMMSFFDSRIENTIMAAVKTTVLRTLEFTVRSTHNALVRGPESLMNDVEIGFLIGNRSETRKMTASNNIDPNNLENDEQANAIRGRNDTNVLYNDCKRPALSHYRKIIATVDELVLSQLLYLKKQSCSY